MFVASLALLPSAHALCTAQREISTCAWPTMVTALNMLRFSKLLIVAVGGSGGGGKGAHTLGCAPNYLFSKSPPGVKIS